MANRHEIDPDIEYVENSIMALNMLTATPSDEINLVITEDINPELKRIHKSFSGDVISNELKKLSRQIESEGESVSCLSLCVEFVGNNIVEQLGSNAENACLNWDFTAFSIWHQMYEGANETLTEIQTVEDYKESVEEYINQLIRDAKSMGGRLSPDIIARSKAAAQRNILLIQKDPTGFLLADDLVAQAAEADQTTFYIEGVKLAAARYKEAYTITQIHRI